MKTHADRTRRLAAVVGIVLGVAGGSYGIASAASGSGSSTSTTASPSAGLSAASPQQAPPAPNASQPWGGQRSDETLLTGDTKAKVEAAALAKVAGGTIVRVETDADDNAMYEAHMTKADGTPTTVYVDQQFDVVSVETR